MATNLGRFLILAKLASEWSAANPVLMNGELGVSDPGSAAPVFKVGDGVRPWSALPQISGAGGGGASPDYVVGTTTTLAPGSFATVTIDNTASPPTISFGIPRGNVGPPNSLAIGTVSTGAPLSPASATITGTAPSQTLNLVIPQGPQGPAGEDGDPGSTGPAGAAGPANSLAIGTVTTGAPGSSADATITGTPPSQTLSLTIPQGDVGPMGPPGPAGSTANLANPTAVIGLAVVNGVSPDAMRSDAAPPLSQAIAPTWTGAHVFAAAVDFTDIFKLDGVEGTAGQVLVAQGAGLTPQWGAALALADPSATIGLVAIPGVAATAMRSDAAPALSQAIAPTWTGAHVFNGAVNFTDVFALDGAPGTAGQVMTSLGVGQTPQWATPLTLANPSALVGLTAVNGSSVTAMRSDAAPALSQAIVPTWSGAHTFTNVLKLREVADPGLAAADEYWLTAQDDSGITRLWSHNARAAWVINQDNYVIGRNTSGSTIARFRAVRATGGSANRPTIALADASTGPAGGITAASAANNAFVEVMTLGVLTNVDTSAWAPGTKLYLGTAGVLTSVAPAFPNSLQLLGVVLDQHASQGSVYISRTADVRAALISGDAFANPTASIGLTAVNGSALTAMRSDAAPALAQTIAPTWTGVHNFGSAAAMQTTATIGARGRVNAFEFGHTNAAGYGSTLGYQRANGWPFLAFHAEHGTADNTYRTRGIVGRVLTSDASGNLIIGRAPTATADDQALVTDLTVTALGVSVAGTLDVAGQLTITSQFVELRNASGPVLKYIDTDAATDEKNWRTRHNNGAYIVSSENDAGTEVGQALNFSKTGTGGVINTMSFGNPTHNPVFNFLGSGVATFGAIVRVGNGTNALPSYSFSSDTDTGFYWGSANTIRVALGGALKAVLAAGASVLNLISDDASGDVYMGFYESNSLATRKGYLGYGQSADDTFTIMNEENAAILLGTNGSVRWTITGDGTQIISTPLYRGPDGSAATPSYSFTSDPNSGMYSAGADILGFSTGGIITALMAGNLLSVGDGTAAYGDRFRLRNSAAASVSNYHHYFSVEGASQLAMYAYDQASTAIGSLRFGYSQVKFADGTVAAPVVTFASEPGSGLFRVGAGNAGFAISGAKVLDIFGNALSIRHATTRAELNVCGYGATAGANPFDLLQDNALAWVLQRANLPLVLGTNGAVRLTIAADGGLVVGAATGGTQGVGTLNATGLYVNGVAVGSGGFVANPTATIGLTAVNGSATSAIRSDGAPALSQAIVPTWSGQHTFSQPILAANGALATPGIAFSGDPNTGIFHGITADSMDLVTGGVSRLLLSTTVIVMSVAASAPSFQSTSSRAIKRETGAPRRAASILSRLRPILYRLLAGDDREQLGLIAEEVHEVCPQLSDGKTVSYDRLALLLLAAWQDERAPIHEG